MVSNFCRLPIACRVVVITLLMTLGVHAPAHAESVGIAAIVGDQVITTTDVRERRDLLMATASIPATEENRRAITPRIIQALIDETLQLQEAKNQSLVVSDEELKKAIDSLGPRSDGKESLRSFITSNNLSMRSFENQLRAQLAWNKVVQRKLRRNVSIASDEVERARKAAANAPGEAMLTIQGIEITRGDKKNEALLTRSVEAMLAELNAGEAMANVAARYKKQLPVQFNPPLAVLEKTLPPALEERLRSLKNGEVAAPIPSAKSIQIIQLLSRQTASKQAENTEYYLKQIQINAPSTTDASAVARVKEAIAELRANPGDCESDALPAVVLPSEASFVRTTFAALSPPQRELLDKLEVGDISPPLASPTGPRLIMLCEKIEPTAGNLPDADSIRQQLFTEKLDLEAQKLLRNLRRDAFIDVKGMKE